MLPVAPRVGAWIETLWIRPFAPNERSHPVWVRGLKHNDSQELIVFTRCRTPCGCVD